MTPTPTPLDEPVIAGPIYMYDKSFVIEFLQPHPSRDATVLMRATYIHTHPLCKTGKAHPQSPPLHIHFDQSETFQVLSGKVGTTQTYDAVDRIWTAADAPQKVTPWTPHNFWPCADAEEDTTILVWAHPENVPEPMDWLFFQNLLWLISDISEGKRRLDPFQIMLLQHVSATALVWFPTVKFLGPLRWWVPWKVQGAFAAVARLLGYKPLLEKYTPAAEWAEIQQAKKTV